MPLACKRGEVTDLLHTFPELRSGDTESAYLTELL